MTHWHPRNLIWLLPLLFLAGAGGEAKSDDKKPGVPVERISGLLPVHSGPIRGGNEFTTAAATKAFEEYLIRIDEIERVAAERKAEAKERLTQALRETAQFEAEAGSRYRGMLGSYFNPDGRIPFIMLSVPSGENVLGQQARSALNGRYDMTKPLFSFHARGHVVIPESGTYYLEASRGHADVKLNNLGFTLGTSAPGNRYRADVELIEGVYEVYFSVGNNGGQLPEASIRIVDKTTDAELPIFIYQSELKEFLQDRSFGVELIETSNWSPEENRIE